MTNGSKIVCGCGCVAFIVGIIVMIVLFATGKEKSGYSVGGGILGVSAILCFCAGKMNGENQSVPQPQITERTPMTSTVVVPAGGLAHNYGGQFEVVPTSYTRYVSAV